MSDQDDWDFAGDDDAKAEIRAAVTYLLNGAAGSDRGDIVREIIEIVNDVTRELAPGRPDPFDDELPASGWLQEGRWRVRDLRAVKTLAICRPALPGLSPYTKRQDQQ
jgi:hypothetical protein